jgi:hypothetical protein
VPLYRLDGARLFEIDPERIAEALETKAPAGGKE